MKIIKQINQINPDVIHLQGEHPWFDLTLPYLSRKYPLVITVHDVTLHCGDKESAKFPSFMYQMNRRYGHHFIVHGKKLKTEMLTNYDKPSDNIHVLPRGINSIYNRYAKETIPDQESPSILFFGRIWPYKGLKYLIEAEPLITKVFPNVKITIAGTGENFENYSSLMANKDNFVVYNDFISNDMVTKLFQDTSVVVLPYVDASQSGVVPLAYAFKKPVIVTNVGSLPEVVDDGKTGFIVPPKDSYNLARAVIKLLSNDKKRIEMGKNAFKKAAEELSWNSIAHDTIKVYEKALSQSTMVCQQSL